MYAIYAGDVCVYNDVFAVESMKAINPKLVLEDNAAGSLALTLTPANAGYETIQRLTTDISVRKDGTELWAGRVLSEEMDFWNNRVLYCEGELAFLNDSIQPPKEYIGKTIRGFLEELIQIHNSKVPQNRQFAIGAVSVHNDVNYTFYTNYEKTMEILNGLIEEYGGHIRVRKENGVRYLDYLAKYQDTCNQVIQFGKNLIDFTRQWDSTEFATVIVPLGNRLEQSPIEALDAYLTVESVNQGSMYVQSEEAVKAYGWIEKSVTWDDVADPSVLLDKAKAYLTDLQFDNMVLELSALDLHYLDADFDAVNLLDEIRVISRPHGLNRVFPVTQMEIPLDSPEKTQFKLGTTVRTSLTSVNNQTNAAILQKIENLPKAHSLLEEAKKNASAIMNLATTGYITITRNESGSETLYISNELDYTKSTKLWMWNLNGLGYSTDGGKNFNLAITMDGAIVADFITTGTLSADLIRTGILKSINENVVFNLNEGTLVMKKGSIQLGDYSDDSEHYQFEVDDTGRMYAGSSAIFAGTLNAAKGTFGGELVAATGKFQGELVAASGTFGGELTAASGTFNGDLVAAGGTFNGDLVAAGGTFNGDLVAANGTFRGELVAATGTFSGELVAASGRFNGIVQASAFLDKSGNSMMRDGKFDSKYLDLYGLTIRDYRTNEITFAVSSTGKVTLNGNVTLGAGSTINWATISNTNIGFNPAYSLADTANTNAATANTNANSAYSLANTANSNAKTANRNANQAISDAADALDTAVGARTATRTLNTTVSKIVNGTYEGGTFIDGQTIYSPTLIGTEIYWGKKGAYGSLKRGYGSDGKNRTNIVEMYSNYGMVLTAVNGMRFEAAGVWFNLDYSDIHVRYGGKYIDLGILIEQLAPKK